MKQMPPEEIAKAINNFYTLYEKVTGKDISYISLPLEFKMVSKLIKDKSIEELEKLSDKYTQGWLKETGPEAQKYLAISNLIDKIITEKLTKK